MPRSSGVAITGLRETIRALERYGVEVADLKAAFGQISDEIVGEARGNVDDDSGALGSTIRAARTKNKAVVRAGSAGVPYAGAINYGWPGHNIEAQDYLTGPANADPAGKAARIEANLQALIVKYRLN